MNNIETNLNELPFEKIYNKFYIPNINSRISFLIQIPKILAE